MATLLILQSPLIEELIPKYPLVNLSKTWTTNILSKKKVKLRNILKLKSRKVYLFIYFLKRVILEVNPILGFWLRTQLFPNRWPKIPIKKKGDAFCKRGTLEHQWVFPCCSSNATTRICSHIITYHAPLSPSLTFHINYHFNLFLLR